MSKMREILPFKPGNAESEGQRKSGGCTLRQQMWNDSYRTDVNSCIQISSML